MLTDTEHHKPHQSHNHCAVCAPIENNPHSLSVHYQQLSDHSIFGKFDVLNRHQGYTGLLHGGIASSLLDGAMTHCLLSMGVEALTAQLDVRYHAPIALKEHIEITARCEREKRGVYQLVAQLSVNEEVRVSAIGKFIRPKT
ncbi:PaaI family thioesterase [uncultured Vibrio sp.]|uniref:PaaI family thioesterase n=1 Tax=uncultured Vibrio sp. TaxID=114054 RepID=UPI002AA73082|nr:PaaI family thioesterase [uncultured Vibrio sp.]